MVERRHHFGVWRQQHRIAKHVARHVTDADYGEVLALDVASELAEVALDRLPSTTRRDAHRLVVVTGAAAGGERVAEPEAVFCRGPLFRRAGGCPPSKGSKRKSRTAAGEAGGRGSTTSRA